MDKLRSELQQKIDFCKTQLSRSLSHDENIYYKSRLFALTEILKTVKGTQPHEYISVLRDQAERGLERCNRLRNTPSERAFCRGVLHAVNTIQKAGDSVDKDT